MALFGKKTTYIGDTYAPGKTFNPENTYLGGSWEDLYNNTGVLYEKATGNKIADVQTDPGSLNLTAEQQQAVNNNKNLKDTQERLRKQGANTQQSVLGGRGY